MSAAARVSHHEAAPLLIVDPLVLLQWLVNGRRVTVIDVREPEELEATGTRFPWAQNVPLHQLFVRRDELPHKKTDIVVAASNDGVRSRAAAFTLSLLGYADVRSLDGGLTAWKKKGFPVE